MEKSIYTNFVTLWSSLYCCELWCPEDIVFLVGIYLSFLFGFFFVHGDISLCCLFNFLMSGAVESWWKRSALGDSFCLDSCILSLFVSKRVIACVCICNSWEHCSILIIYFIPCTDMVAHLMQQSCYIYIIYFIREVGFAGMSCCSLILDVIFIFFLSTCCWSNTWCLPWNTFFVEIHYLSKGTIARNFFFNVDTPLFCLAFFLMLIILHSSGLTLDYLSFSLW